MQVLCSSRKWVSFIGMPDIDTLNIIKINCIIISTQGNDRTNECSTNTAIQASSKHMEHYTNTM